MRDSASSASLHFSIGITSSCGVVARMDAPRCPASGPKFWSADLRVGTRTALPLTAGQESPRACARRRGNGAAEGGSSPARSRAASNRNGVAARRGGEQRREEDPSVTQTARMGYRRERDSVGVGGRASGRKAKLVGAVATPLAAGRSPVVAPRVGDGMAGSPPAIIRETRRGQAAFMAAKPESPAPANPPSMPAEPAPRFPQRGILQCLSRGGMSADGWLPGLK